MCIFEKCLWIATVFDICRCNKLIENKPINHLSIKFIMKVFHHLRNSASVFMYISPFYF